MLRFAMNVGLVTLLAACGGLVDGGAAIGERRIGNQGGTVESVDGVRVVIPARAWDDDVLVTVEAVGLADQGPGVLAEAVVLPARELAEPATVSFVVPEGTDPVRLKVSVEVSEKYRGLSGWGFDASTRRLSARTSVLGTFALSPSLEQCANGQDDDEDGLADCADPTCAGVAGCAPAAGGPDAGSGGLICAADDQCTCTPCTSTSECATGMGLQCSPGKSHGTECGFNVCQVPETAG